MLNKTSMVRVDTGVEGLNQMLGGGFYSGRTIMVSGQTGTGKTTLAMQFIYNGVKQFNEPGVFITLEQNKEKLREDMKKVGMDINEIKNRFTLIGGSTAEVLRYQEKTKANMHDFLEEIEEVIKKSNAKRVAIDSLNLFLMLLKSDAERRMTLLKLIEIFSKYNCTALLTCEVRENTFDLSWYGFEEFVVDGIIAFYTTKFNSTFLHGLTIRKMRGMEHRKNIVRYKITNNGIVVFPKDKWV